jgi:hypothetical protein
LIMAILYGTTAGGDSLPVEVNNLGQLVAEGLPGPPGPAGPPGIGELPPGPVEGDALIWQGGQLVWGSVSGGGMQIKQIQRGFISVSSSIKTVYVSISPVDTAKSLLTALGCTDDMGLADEFTWKISLDSGSRIRADVDFNYWRPLEISYELVEYE